MNDFLKGFKEGIQAFWDSMAAVLVWSLWIAVLATLLSVALHYALESLA